MAQPAGHRHPPPGAHQQRRCVCAFALRSAADAGAGWWGRERAAGGCSGSCCWGGDLSQACTPPCPSLHPAALVSSSSASLDAVPENGSAGPSAAAPALQRAATARRGAAAAADDRGAMQRAESSGQARAWQSVRHVNGVAVYAEEEGLDGEGGAFMVSAIVRSSPAECFEARPGFLWGAAGCIPQREPSAAALARSTAPHACTRAPAMCAAAARLARRSAEPSHAPCFPC